DRLTFAALRVISRHRRGGPYQISEATLGSLIPLRGPSSLRGRDFRVVRVFGLAYLACDLGTEWRRWKMLDKTEQSDWAANPNEKPEVATARHCRKGPAFA